LSKALGNAKGPCFMFTTSMWLKVSCGCCITFRIALMAPLCWLVSCTHRGSSSSSANNQQ